MSINKRILIVDDEEDILEILSFNLSREGYQIDTASNGMEALEKLQTFEPHLIIMDVMMPEMDGIEACEQIRQTDKGEQIFILLLTARSEDYSQIAGYNAGADDYITKPVKPKILSKKVSAFFRRTSTKKSDNDNLITLDGLTINRETYIVTQEDKTVSLPKKEFELLYLLASQPGKVFEREEILKHVWGDDVVVVGRTIDVHIRKLREKIGSNHFATVKGVGYKFNE